tara:strand:+ start:148 stop:507 length:360 start_codon:yes stop_codon:yes gene_type:complete
MKEEAYSRIIELMDEQEKDDEINNPLDHFTEEQIDNRLEKLNVIQAVLEKDIADYSIDKTMELLQLEEEKDIYRVMLFSKGLDQYLVVFTSDAQISAYDLNTPNDLLARCFNATASLVS